VIVAELVSTAGAQQPPAPPAARLQFGLSSILLFVTLVAILCSIIKMSPGLGIPLAILAGPALLRTCVVALRHSASGSPMSASEKAQAFAVSLAMVFTVVLTAVGAFIVVAGVVCATSVPAAGRSDRLAMTFAVAGLVAGLAAATTVTWLFWKHWIGKRK
jgi:hypothetical protein